MVASLRAEVRKLRKEVEEARSVAQDRTEELERFDRYKGKPIEFIEEVLQVKLTNDQKAICRSVVKNKETNVPAGHGVGKTLCAACIVIYWVFVEHGLAVTTAPTKRQVNELLWGEIRKLFDRYQHRLGGERGQTFLRLTEQARSFGFTSRDRNLDGFQGLHSEKLLVVEDEANGITEEIDDGAMSCVTGSKNRILRIGNPTVGGTPFEKSCRLTKHPIPVWQHLNVSWAYELASEGSEAKSPGAPHGKKVGEYYLKPEVAADVLDESGKVKPIDQWSEPYRSLGDQIPGAVSIDWIEDNRVRKGENSAFWCGRVNAQFPQDNAQSIVPRSWFKAARARYDKDPDYWQRVAAQARSYRHGVDVSDGGDDATISTWRGNVLLDLILVPTRGDREDTERICNAAWKQLMKYPGVMGVDRIGVGAGVLSGLLTRLKDEENKREIRLLPIVPTAVGINFGGKAENELADAEALNLKADLYWGLREEMEQDTIAIAPIDPELEERLEDEFALQYYEETVTGKIKMEDKKKVKARIHRSPDCADAVVMGYGVKAVAQSSAADTGHFLSVMS